MSVTVKKVVRWLQKEKPETSRPGERVHRAFLPSSRYAIDFAPDFKAEGWKQYDTNQDAEYYGVWVNAGQWMTLCYAEGDWARSTYAERDAYRDAVVRLGNFHGEGSVCRTIDDDGTYTVYRQDRREFLDDAREVTE